jgi:hypothetical protein
VSSVGRRRWLVAGGNVPIESTGREPELTSHDAICVLNANGVDADIEVTVYYVDRDPVGPYSIRVHARRVRRVRINDLIDPSAVELGVDFGLLIESSEPVVVQVSRQDTSGRGAIMGTTGFPLE